MLRLVLVLLVFSSVSLYGQSIGSNAGPGGTAVAGQAASKIDSALEAFKNGKWRQVVALFDSIVSKNYFTDNQLFHAAYKSLEKLSEESGPAERESYKNRSQEVYSQSIDEWGRQVTEGGINLKVYSIVDRNPEPLSGFRTYNDDLQSRLVYPEQALAGKIEGRVFVQFVVNRDGTIDGVKVLRGIDPQCDSEAVRLIKSGEAWKPGYLADSAVYVRMTLPVDFNIREYRRRQSAGPEK